MALIIQPEEIDRLRTSGKILATAMEAVRKAVAPGVTTAELDAIARHEIEAQGGQPSFLGFQNYPAALCVSVNHEVVHGIPDSTRSIQAGDVVGLDLGVNYQGAFTDHAITVAVGRVPNEAKQLIRHTRAALQAGIRQAKAGNHVGDISAAIEQSLEPHGYGIVTQLTGHGVGRAVHEAPPIPNVGPAGSGPELAEGEVLAIEPMVTLGDPAVRTLADGWTIETVDHSLAAHFEHTIRVTKRGHEVITDLHG